MAAKNWVFTLNNYSIDEESQMQVSHPEVTFIVYGHEVGENGTPHLQGYVELSKRMSVQQLKRMFDVPRLHLEVRRGTQRQAIDYCKKDGNDIYERGTPSTGPGRPTAAKNKLLPFIPLVKHSLSEFASHPEASFHLLRHAKEYVSLCESPRKRTDPLTVRWYWGPTGSGKTRRAFDEAEAAGIEPFVKSGNFKWFDGYEGHQFVIFDDFRDAHCEFGWLLRLLDIYPLTVEIKGGTRQWKPKTVVITSPMPPEECYRTMQATDKYDKISQLLRRITIVEHITEYKGPQTPQGGLNISSKELITPPKFLYPVTRSPACQDLPRPQHPLLLLNLLQEDCQSPPQVPSPTQDWKHPDCE